MYIGKWTRACFGWRKAGMIEKGRRAGGWLGGGSAGKENIVGEGEGGGEAACARSRPLANGQSATTSNALGEYF